MRPDLSKKVQELQGPILVLGASGFVGANLLRMLLDVRTDVIGTASPMPAWRLEGLPGGNVVAIDLLIESDLRRLLDRARPLTIFDCVAYGAYSFERDADLIALGTRGLSGTEHLLLGSTSARVVQHASCPVLTVRC